MNGDTTLKRFTDAQEGSYTNALAEISNGRKTSHWMWYVFPQIKGLGMSETAKYYSIHNVAEAGAYLQHPVLGPRLIAISKQLMQLKSNDAYQIFGSPDDMKLQSSMTLFDALPGTDPVFRQVLEKFYNGKKDNRTLKLLQQ